MTPDPAISSIVSGILDSITDGFQAIGADYRFKYFNEAARRTFVEQGMDPDELIGRHIFDEVFPAERDQPWAVALRRAMVERVPTEVKTFYAPWQRWFATRYYSAPDGGVSVFFQEITERKRAEISLRESEEKYRTVFNSIDEGFCVVEMLLDEQGKPHDYLFLEINPMFEQLTGLRNAVGRTARELIPGLEEFWIETFWRVALTGEPVRFENYAEPMNRWFNVHASRVGDEMSHRVAIVFTNITERKQAEEDLRKSKERFDIVSDAAEVGFWFCDLPFDELIWDHRVKEHFWLPSDAPVTIETFYERLHPDDRERTRQAIEKSIEDNTRYDIEYRTLSPEGEEKWIRHIGRTFYNEHEKPIRFDGVTLDITPRKRDEAERERLVSVAENSRDFIGMFDIEGNPIFVNRGGRDMVGIDDAFDIRTTTIPEYFVPEEREFVNNVVLPAITKEGRWVGELTFRHWKTEAQIPVFYDLFRVDDPKTGRPLNFVTVTRDISERKRAEDALRQADLRFRTMAQSAPVLIWQTDRTGVIFVNRHYLEFFGQTFDSVAGMGWANYLYPDDKQAYESAYRTAFERQTAYEFRCRFQRHDGQYRWLQNAGLPLHGPDKVFLGFVGCSADVTDIKLAEEALRENEQRLHSFAVQLEQRVSERTYELAQSEDRLRALATELNLSEQRERKRLANELHDHLQQTLVLGKLTIGQGKRVAAALPACLDVMKKTDEIFSEALIYTRTLVSDLSPTVLRDHGLPEALQWLGAYMQKYNQTVTVTVPDDEVLKLPEDQVVLLFQSVRELLINSSKHAGTGEATVRMEQRDGLLRIDVRDEGSGFDLAAAAAAAGTPSGGISSKFGLFSIKERMRALGGSFELESTPGKGTAATLTLPLAGQAERDERDMRDKRDVGEPVSLLSPVSRVSKHARIRVLLVDDHIMIRQGLRSVLNAYADIELVGEAGNGEEAVQLVEQMRPAVVVMDINMPKMNGIEATREIRTRYPDIIVIGLSVNAAEESQEAMKRAGAVRLMTKEAAVEDLYDAIQGAVRSGAGGS